MWGFTSILGVSHPCVDTSSLRRHQEQKQQEKLAFERQLDERQKEHTQLLFMNNSHKEDVLNSVKLVPLHLGLLFKDA